MFAVVRGRTLRSHFSIISMSIWLSLFISFLFIRYVLPTVLRLVLSSFVRKQVQKAQQYTHAPFNGPFGPGPQASPQSPGTGQVRVDYVPPTAKTARSGESKMGEYVDFEEV
jgi:hypothetical protein